MGVTEVRFLEPRRLNPGETLEGFSCGVELIDNWANRHRPLCGEGGVRRFHTCVSQQGGEVAGFYAISAYSIDRDAVRGGWLKTESPLTKIPVILLGMLGVDSRFQHQGLGWMLLQDAIKRALAVGRQIGSRALVVDPYDDVSRGFYQHFGFRDVPGSNSMFVRLV